MKRLGLVVLLSCLSACLFMVPYGSQNVGLSLGGTGSWLNGWMYRKSHVVNNASEAGSNYQVKIVVHYGSGVDYGRDVYCNYHSQEDFGDVRFTDATGLALEYWRGKTATSDNATFWVKIDGNLSDSAQLIYMYYGNSTVSSTSNFDGTFIFGDPFDNPVPNDTRWTSIDGGPTYVIDSTEHYIEVTNMETQGLGLGFHSKIFSMPSTWMIQDAYSDEGFMMYHNSEIDSDIFGQALILQNSTTSSGSLGVSCVRVADMWLGDKAIAEDAWIAPDDWFNEWYAGLPYTPRWIIRESANGLITIMQNGTDKIARTNYDMIDRLTWETCRNAYPGSTFGTERLYAFMIRKFASVEPSQGSWGSESKTPFVDSVWRTPESPNYDQEVNVTANVLGEIVDRVILSYANGMTWFNVSMVWLADNTYSTVIPAQPYGTTVQHRIYANDTYGNETVSEIYSYTVGDFKAPEILSVKETPTCPYPYVPSNLTRVREATLITANVSEPTDASGLAFAGISYSVDGGEWWNTTLRLNATSGLYYCIIPAQPAACNVTFIINATDRAGNVAMSPPFGYAVKNVWAYDINGDWKIDVKDVALVARHYGERNP